MHTYIHTNIHTYIQTDTRARTHPHKTKNKKPQKRKIILIFLSENLVYLRMNYKFATDMQLQTGLGVSCSSSHQQLVRISIMTLSGNWNKVGKSLVPEFQSTFVFSNLNLGLAFKIFSFGIDESAWFSGWFVKGLDGTRKLFVTSRLCCLKNIFCLFVCLFANTLLSRLVAKLTAKVLVIALSACLFRTEKSICGWI